jgi:hypothetical protein
MITIDKCDCSIFGDIDIGEVDQAKIEFILAGP